MRNLRKLFMVAALAVVAMAFAAPSASATLPVELMDELNGGAHCPAVDEDDGEATGGCHRSVRSNSVLLIQHRSTGDVVAADCINTYELRVDENGEGWIDDQVLAPGTANCGVAGVVGGITVCTTAPDPGGEEPLWHINIEHDGNGVEEAVAEFCIDDRIAAPISCEWEGDTTVQINESGGDLTAETWDGDVESHFDIEAEEAHETAPVTHAQAEGACEQARMLGEFEIDGHWTIDNEAGQQNTSANIVIEHLS